MTISGTVPLDPDVGVSISKDSTCKVRSECLY